jgi:NADH-quinone oxidoreductase E subunit
MMKFSQDALRRYEAILKRYPDKRAALLPVLKLAQDEFGWISEEVAQYIAELMGYPPSDVMSVASFYTMLKKRPMGKYHMELCRNVTCYLMGAHACAEEIKRRLGIGPGEVTPDGKFSFNFTECLGSCGTAPAMQVGPRYYENLTPQRVAEIIEKLSKDGH